jgi:translocation and assembly module TamA
LKHWSAWTGGAWAVLLAAPTAAQTTPAPVPAPQTDEQWVSELDPDAPMEPLPEMEVPWPDLDAPLPEPAPLPSETAESQAPDLPPAVVPPTEVLAGEPELVLPPSLLADTDEGAAIVSVGSDQLPAQVDAEGQMRYRVELGNLGEAENPELRDRFAGLSVLRVEAGEPANAAQINRRIVEDTDLVARLLRNNGFYDASLGSTVSGDGSVLSIRFDVTPGPLYRYDEVRINGLNLLPAEEATRLSAAFAITPGSPIIADTLLDAQGNLLTTMLETGYPFGEIGEELITIDHDTRLGDLDQPVVPGNRLRFGAIIADDGGLLGARHIARIARFRPGEWYRQSDVDDLRRALIATGLVSSVDLTPVQGTGDTVDLTIDIEPAPPRTLAGAIGYSSGEGFRVEASWEHRNLFPPEGALIVRGVLGTQEQLAALTYRRSNFRRRDNILTVQTLVSNIDRPAFLAQTALISARLERQSTLIFQKRWTWSVGAELVATDELDQRRIVGAGRETFFVGALPTTLGYDRSNSLLDPTSGFRLLARVSPELSIRGDASPYVRAQFDATGYFPVSDRVVLAGRVRVGTISGAALESIAPSRRFYVGPLDAFGEPDGGRSLFEVATEARIRVPWLNDAFSIVPFIDAGNVYRTQYPDFSGIRVGAGIGVRYHSSFGPIRVDVGTPINPRAGDSRVTVYVSLGQAF